VFATVCELHDYSRDGLIVEMANGSRSSGLALIRVLVMHKPEAFGLFAAVPWDTYRDYGPELLERPPHLRLRNLACLLWRELQMHAVLLRVRVAPSNADCPRACMPLSQLLKFR
jgi:hypothetical protein